MQGTLAARELFNPGDDMPVPRHLTHALAESAGDGRYLLTKMIETQQSPVHVPNVRHNDNAGEFVFVNDPGRVARVLPGGS